MDDADDEALPYLTGFSTPPLSPTKTISTEGWLSPKTPGSPCKSRNGILVPGLDHVDGSLRSVPHESSIGHKIISHFSPPSIEELSLCVRDPIPSQSNCGSPVKRNQNATHSFQNSKTSSARLYHPSSTDIDISVDNDVLSPSEHVSISKARDHDAALDGHRYHNRNNSESSFDTCGGTPLQTSSLQETLISNNDSIVPSSTPSDEKEACAAKSSQSNLSHTSSPLRPSQWATRGGLLSSPGRSQTSTPDRFIPSRRPPAIVRESFELNKPTQRVVRQQMACRGLRLCADVFGRRLRRSGRLNEELRGLRETHSMISSRIVSSRRNINFRRSPILLSARQVSAGAVWNVGGPSAVSDTVIGVSTGTGGILGCGTNAPLYKSAFLNRADPEAELEAYEQRLALALDVDQVERVLQYTSPAQNRLHNLHGGDTNSPAKHVWRDSFWVKDESSLLLDAPAMRDDYYCTLLAYSYTAKCLAVGLGDFVHLWSERTGVETPESLNAIHPDGAPESQHVTSLDFSSIQGGQAILAVGRANGSISLWSPFDAEPRFDAKQPKPVSCVSWRPTTVLRSSVRDRAFTVVTEELLVGDELGHIYFYSIEWPSETQSALFGWHGAMTLVARLTVHTQQICGLAWSIDGESFASGGNDNNCHLFETKKVLGTNNTNKTSLATLDVREGRTGESIYTVINRTDAVLHVPDTVAKHKWTLNAAVKAIAFCPWQRGLIAIGGGSNDRCIHFYHTLSGTCLATIDCAAQVTSLIWSRTRREIAATFGFTQPEHPYRIAVFAWPSCEQIAAVPWWDENRALCAVAYPGGPTHGPDADDGRDGRRIRGEDGSLSRTNLREGCIVVAASDMAIRFHEIWSDRKGSLGEGGLLNGGMAGLLGGSDILEGLHGIERESTVIR